MPLTPRCRAWLEKDGRPVFGDGRARLLEAIRRAGSINGGAATLGMSYRNAWVHLESHRATAWHETRRAPRRRLTRRRLRPHARRRTSSDSLPRVSEDAAP